MCSEGGKNDSKTNNVKRSNSNTSKRRKKQKKGRAIQKTKRTPLERYSPSGSKMLREKCDTAQNTVWRCKPKCCAFFSLSRSQPPVLSCDRIASDFQQWESSVEQLMPSTLLEARLPSKVKEKKRKRKEKKKRRGSPHHPTFMTEMVVCFLRTPHTPSSPPSCFKDAELTRCQHRTAAIFRHDFISTEPNSAASGVSAPRQGS